ncbi:MAG: hypothetical protein ACXAEU_06820 [Candidatus Hodarchaeales archaeon]
MKRAFLPLVVVMEYRGDQQGINYTTKRNNVNELVNLIVIDGNGN